MDQFSVVGKAKNAEELVLFGDFAGEVVGIECAEDDGGVDIDEGYLRFGWCD